MRDRARHTPATWMPVAKCELPRIFFLVLCRPSRILPGSVVNVTSTSGPLPPMLIRPTEDSGLPWTTFWKMMLTASAWDSNRVGE